MDVSFEVVRWGVGLHLGRTHGRRRLLQLAAFGARRLRVFAAVPRRLHRRDIVRRDQVVDGLVQWIRGRDRRVVRAAQASDDGAVGVVVRGGVRAPGRLALWVDGDEQSAAGRNENPSLCARHLGHDADAVGHPDAERC